jgi:hypothetical protein
MAKKATVNRATSKKTPPKKIATKSLAKPAMANKKSVNKSIKKALPQKEVAAKSISDKSLTAKAVLQKPMAVSLAPQKGKKVRGVVAPTGIKEQARVLQMRIAESGKTSRIKGHVSARTRRNQAKRDQKNA